MLDLLNKTNVQSDLLDIYLAHEAVTSTLDYLDLKMYYLQKFHGHTENYPFSHEYIPIIELKPSKDFLRFLKDALPDIDKLEDEEYKRKVIEERYYPSFCNEEKAFSKESFFIVAFEEVTKKIPEFKDVFCLLISKIYIKNFQGLISASSYRYPGYIFFAYDEESYPSLELQLGIIHELLHQVIALRECVNNIFTPAGLGTTQRANGALTLKKVPLTSAVHSMCVNLALCEYLILCDKIDIARERLPRFEKSYSSIMTASHESPEPLLTDYGSHFCQNAYEKHHQLSVQLNELVLN